MSSTICKSLENLFLLNLIFLNNSLLRNHGNLLSKLMKINIKNLWICETDKRYK